MQHKFQLNCFVLGDDPSRIFEIKDCIDGECQRPQRLDQGKKKKFALRDVDAYDWMVTIGYFGRSTCLSNATRSNTILKRHLKCVREGQKEIEILQYPAGIDFPTNHTISSFRIWPLRGGQSAPPYSHTIEKKMDCPGGK